ncbi:hypothetical protein [Pukyongiella litopenaei]|uniref:Uncharacterized protein n=1 Tax=Pukyongiella litopenaei TaxID=2605946 RepID=A0A2S0MRB3_9RHOB|nr:hypothetical protein [Pukyongiella litopenaei]AVO38428.2 hypothetical protein C6Y53_12515 [Pukyongiella litopenaei]
MMPKSPGDPNGPLVKPTLADDPQFLYIIRYLSKLATDQPHIQVEFSGQLAELVACKEEDEISGMRWMEFRLKTPLDREGAYESAVGICKAIELTFFERRAGINTGVNLSRDDLGESSGWLSPAVYQPIVDHGYQYQMTKHGIAFYQADSSLVRGIVSGGRLTVVDKIEKLSERIVENFEFAKNMSDTCISAIRNFNHGMATGDQIARLALVVASVEHLSDSGGRWSSAQKKFLDKLADFTSQSSDLNEKERNEIAEQLRNLKGYKVRLGFRRLFERLGLQAEIKNWLDAYDQRSGILHGGGLLSKKEMSALVDRLTDLAHSVLSAQVRFEKETLVS